VARHSRTSQFDRDWRALTETERKRFLAVHARFDADLGHDRRFRPGLRVKGVQGAPGIFEMTWAPDGRATFQYGPAAGDPHVIWRRVGRHPILSRP
jgi:hypothetical protein